MNQLIADEYNRYAWMIQEPQFTDEDRAFFKKVRSDMPDEVAAVSLKKLSEWLFRYYGKKVIILLDEYDTPMQEAYIHGFWDELTAYIRALFNSTFKTNPSLARAVMTGITRVSKESIFSDLNNLVVVTTTSSQYADCFGFTEEEVFTALDEQGYGERERADVKLWYDGFTFGGITDIYNPWSVIISRLVYASVCGTGMICRRCGFDYRFRERHADECADVRKSDEGKLSGRKS